MPSHRWGLTNIVSAPVSPHRAFNLEGEEAKSSWLPDGLSQAWTWIWMCGDNEYKDKLLYHEREGKDVVRCRI